MNTIMEDLMYNAGLTAHGCLDEMDDYDRKAIDRFYKLIVQECVNIVGHADLIKQHFGIKE